MRRISPTTSRKLDRFLRQQGFGEVPGRGKGSHILYQHPDGRSTSVPNHPGDLGPRIIAKILRDARLSRDDYLAMR